MTKIPTGRNMTTDRISAYECQLHADGAAVRGRYVTGWYGLFSKERLVEEFMPKLAEYADQGHSYPFLLTYHQLGAKTTVTVNPPRNIKFTPRVRASLRIPLAIVFSRTEYRILNA